MELLIIINFLFSKFIFFSRKRKQMELNLYSVLYIFTFIKSYFALAHVFYSTIIGRRMQIV